MTIQEELEGHPALAGLLSVVAAQNGYMVELRPGRYLGVRRLSGFGPWWLQEGMT